MIIDSQYGAIAWIYKAQWDADCRYVIGTGIGFFPSKWTFVVLWYFVFAGGTHWQWRFIAKSLSPYDNRLLDFKTFPRNRLLDFTTLV